MEDSRIRFELDRNLQLHFDYFVGHLREGDAAYHVNRTQNVGLYVRLDDLRWNSDIDRCAANFEMPA